MYRDFPIDEESAEIALLAAANGELGKHRAAHTASRWSPLQTKTILKRLKRVVFAPRCPSRVSANLRSPLRYQVPRSQIASTFHCAASASPLAGRARI